MVRSRAGLVFGATVLAGKVEVWVFQEAVHEDDEFAHDGSEGDFRWFSGGAEPGIKGFEDVVMADGAQGGHVKRLPDGTAPATDATEAGLMAAVTIVRGDPSQGRSGLVGESAQFWHFGQQSGRHHRADARDGVQPAGFGGQFRVLGNQLGDGGIALGRLFFQGFDELS